MSTRWISRGFYVIVAAAALAVNASFAQVPTMGPDGWVLPANEPSSMAAAPAAAGNDYEAAIYDACARHGCDPGYVIGIMYCESGGDPGAYHPNPYGGADIGLMQINDATWGSIAYAGPYEQIEWSAQMIAAGYGHHWVCG